MIVARRRHLASLTGLVSHLMSSSSNNDSFKCNNRENYMSVLPTRLPKRPRLLRRVVPGAPHLQVPEGSCAVKRSLPVSRMQ